MDPPDICKLASLNRAFHAASSADFIWESKLPSNYVFFIEKCLVGRLWLTIWERRVFMPGFVPTTFDGGAKEIWLDKKRGRVCLSISSKALKITGIDDRRYWNFISSEESRFHKVAYLRRTWWFEVRGEIEFQFPAGNYSIFFKLHSS